MLWRRPASGDPAALADPTLATRRAMRRLGRRITALNTEIADTDTDLAALVADTAPSTCDLFGAGPETVGQLLVTAGDNPERLRSEATWARLLAAAPIPASSGNTSHDRAAQFGCERGDGRFSGRWGV